MNYQHILLKIPIVNLYCRLLLFLKQEIRIFLITYSKLIQRQPPSEFLSFCESTPTFIYFPWIKTLTNQIMESIPTTNYQIVAFPCFKDTHNLTQRKKINFYCQYKTREMETILRAWLSPLAGKIRGFLLSFDYQLLPRILVNICKEFQIKTVLIPHESIFFNQDKFYTQPKYGFNVPICDYVLCWGDLQKEIFIKRGFPTERIFTVGTPKFDAYYNYQPQFSHQSFCSKANLNPQKKIILYAAQTFDFQVNQSIALKKQEQLLTQLIQYSQENNTQLIIRTPPTQWQVLSQKIIKKMKKAGGFIDYSQSGYLFTPQESIYHADLIISINSTMLFEALLLGKKALSVKYFDFESCFLQTGIAYITQSEQLESVLNHLFHKHDNEKNNEKNGEITMSLWAKKAFSIGDFDGQAGKRISQFLENI